MITEGDTDRNLPLGVSGGVSHREVLRVQIPNSPARLFGSHSSSHRIWISVSRMIRRARVGRTVHLA